MRKKRTWMIIGVGVVLALCVAGGLFVRNQMSTVQAQLAGTGEVVTAFVGDLAAGTTATGEVSTRQSAQLVLPTSGTVAEVVVQVGDVVQAGDVLVRLDTAVLERAVTDAEQSLIIQEANLAALQEPATAVSIAAAEASVASAQAQLDDLLAGPTEAEIAAAAANVEAAQADVAAGSTRLNNAQNGASAAEIQAAQLALQQAQTTATQATEQHTTILATIQDGNAPEGMLDDAELAARVNVLQANGQLAAAQETLNNLLDGNPNDVATAQGSLATAVAQRNLAQAQYDLLLAPASASQIAAAEATLAQAQASLDQLRRGPTAAPFAGVITAVHVQPGEVANGILVEMTNNNDLEVVLSVNEVDLSQIELGQETTVTLESWPDTPISGRVQTIAPTAVSEVGSSLVSFPVTISLDETELPIRVGMTANAALELARREDVLLVPNGAIQVDRENGTYNVILVRTNEQGQTMNETVPVTIGLRDGRYTEVTSGIQEGDELLIPDPTATNPFTPGGGNGPDGGGGPFGG